MKTSGIVVAGAASGVGKTSVTCAVIYGLKRRGFSVQPFKVGPDYIDPGYLSSVSGNDTYNLDAWLMGTGGLRDQFVRHSRSDISVIEGVMGYYDGVSGDSNRASTHHVAAITGSRTILVLDAARAARSVAATALGFARLHRNHRISGVVLNRVGSEKHAKLCTDALQSLGTRSPALAAATTVLGTIPRIRDLTFESRHLGLVPAGEQRGTRGKILKAAKGIAAHIDFDRVLRMAAGAGPPVKGAGSSRRPRPRPRPEPERRDRTCTVAVARDASFNFYYRANLDALRRRGAALRFFSPVSDERPPACDGLYIGGGFPEVLSGQLAKNSRMKRAIKAMAQDGMPVYAECGGLMYLTRSIHDGRKKHTMVGFLDADTRMTGKMRLNYTAARVLPGCALLSGAKRRIHGHEFHYSELYDVPGDTRFAYDLETGHGISGKRDGIIQDGTLASYGHLFFDGTGFADGFVASCAAFSRR